MASGAEMALIVWLCCLMVIFFPAGAGAAEAFQKPQPGRVWQFPADHGSHPEYKTEWWYWVGHLKSSGRRDLRLPAHLFPGGPAPTGPAGPFGLAPEHRLFRPSGRNRSGPRPLSTSGKRRAGAPWGWPALSAGRLRVWLDDWQAEQVGEAMHLQARDEGLGLDLTLTPLKPPALHGEDGLSRKAAQSEAASYYYSVTRLDTQGHLTLNGRTLEVDGASWMDHEFFSSAMAHELVGWDWFALQLDDGREVMLYLLRHRDGSLDPASSGTLVDAAGKTRHLSLNDFQVKSHRRLEVPALPGGVSGGLADQPARGRAQPHPGPHPGRPGGPGRRPGQGELLGRSGKNPGPAGGQPHYRPGLRGTHRLCGRHGRTVLRAWVKKRGSAAAGPLISYI